MRLPLLVGLLCLLFACTSHDNVIGLDCKIDGANGTFNLSLILDLESKVAEYSDQTDSFTNLKLLVAPSQFTVSLPGDLKSVLRISRKDLSIVRWSHLYFPEVGFDKQVEHPGTCTRVKVDLNNAI